MTNDKDPNTQVESTQTIAVIPPSDDLVPPPREYSIERTVALDRGQAFAIIIEAPTSPLDVLRPAFVPNHIEITLRGTPPPDDVGIFGIYVDRIPSLIGQYPIPVEAFAPVNPAQGSPSNTPIGVVTPFSLVEIIGRNFSVGGEGVLTLRLRGPIVSLAALRISHANASRDWFASSHALALKRTIDMLEAEAKLAATQQTEAAKLAETNVEQTDTATS